MRAIDLAGWIERHRDQLRPPVGNARLFEDGDFIIMVVGGPNRRQDFHIDPGEELFFQLTGDMVLRVADGDGALSEVAVPQGSMFLLPAGVPHSPQRPVDSVGLVVERKRSPGERDGLRWYCERCEAPLHEVFFELLDITTQLGAAIHAWEREPAHRTCAACGHRTEPR
ncbi:MAG: 3-hydroxyanthranilate 3,4-dioxygenase [Nannocystaceae bacterium]|nr:3-hydroxyanthranilate 3,4-dioxygenase [Nannocystaceae bacterium]